MKTIQQLWQGFESGQISKHEYINLCFENLHLPVQALKEWLASTAISAVEIGDNGLVVSSRLTGSRFYCPQNDRRSAPVEAINFRHYEQTEFDTYRRFISEESIVFDIGANIGWYSVHWAQLFPTAQIHAFEPIPSTFDCLVRNVALNSISNIRCHMLALSNIDSEVAFFIDPNMTVNASMQNISGSSDAVRVLIPTQTLDGYVSKIGLDRLDTIKCDVEGAEFLVLKGAEATLAQNRPVVFAEMLRKWSAKFDYHPNDIIDFMSAFGYLCYPVNASLPISIKHITDETVETNFVFVHKEQIGRHGLE